MCAIVIVGDRECMTRGELRVAIGIDPVGYGELAEDDDCMCCVDVEATLKASGRTYWQDDIGDYYT